MEDCKLFNVGSTVMWHLWRLLVRSEEIVKRIRKEMAMVGNKANNKKGIHVENVKDI